MSEKLCRDCKHFVNENEACSRDKKTVQDTDLVTGKVSTVDEGDFYDCRAERYIIGYEHASVDPCGIDGKHFESSTLIRVIK